MPTLNPLGKIPVLVLDDGRRLYDSRVIVEYLDTVSPVTRLIPEPSGSASRCRRWEALADGICDAAARSSLERRRPQRQQSKDWRSRARRGKVDAGVAELARELGERPWCNGEGYTLADIATGCALGYLDLRHPELDWRDAHPQSREAGGTLGQARVVRRHGAAGARLHGALHTTPSPSLMPAGFPTDVAGPPLQGPDCRVD